MMSSYYNCTSDVKHLEMYRYLKRNTEIKNTLDEINDSLDFAED